LQLTVDKLIYGGDGLARMPADEHGPGKVVFVPFVLKGERIEASLVEQRPGFARARADQVIESSPSRIGPHCPYFMRCGGCHYQHASYEHQLEIKAEILKENLRRIAKIELDVELKVHSSPPWNYRNRTRLRIQTVPEFAIGYYRFGSRELLPVEECPISSPLVNRAIAVMWQMGRAGRVAEGIAEIEFFANSDDTQLLVEVLCSPKTLAAAVDNWAEKLRSELPQLLGVVAFRQARSGSSVWTQAEPERIAAVGVENLTYQTARASYRVSAGSFFQVNRHLTDELVTIVTEGCSGGMALDLYAGVGLFSTVLNREFDRVIAVESSQTSFADLQYNSPANLRAVRATVEQYFPEKAAKLRPDLVVVDPPRNGLGGRVLHGLVGLKAPRITYVSCDPATLARDLKHLIAAGYKLEQAHLVDLFPQTYHLESVMRLVR
jgi:23S rRNA (uracil1939-C5)-methyltransferase